MPELPEVETVVRGLQGPVVGRTFTAVTVDWPRSVRPSPEALRLRLPGRRVAALTRRAKYLVFHLEGGGALLIHLKMSGNLRVEPAGEPMPGHVHIVFELDNGHQLRFQDTRKFGRVYLVDNPAEVTDRLGPEPLAPGFTAAKFRALFAGRRGRLKPMLLKQEFLAGVGNIYADEGCFRAGLDPRRPVQSLAPAELNRLHRGLRAALRTGIMHRGASLDAVYRGGEFQNHFRVYGRTGEPCVKCRTPVRRVILGGRSTHFCPRCQQ
jgi:formamidopyrimidine-DNA glycosylase